MGQGPGKETRVSENQDFMRRAIEIAAADMRANCGGPFGAVIVKDGRIVAEGANLVTSSNDPTAHAEVVAIRKACHELETFHLSGCEIYASCEPCPMCLAAIYWAHIDRIHYANSRDDAARIGFDDAFIYDEIPKSPEARRIPMVRVELAEARAVFEEWKNKPDKILY
jgi:tRNA(Arg) A34 adenosine deaminase TadA